MKRNHINKISLAIFISVLVITSSMAKELGFASDRVKLIRVIDGDSFETRITIWHQNEITTIIRLSGIDTPEIRGKCDKETQLAQTVKAFTKKWLSEASLSLTDITPDKYNNRYIATASLLAHQHDLTSLRFARLIRQRAGDTQDLSDALLAAKLAQPYPPKKSWCE